MRAVLGIDAAWTLTEPSGVALVADTAEGWRLLGLASSYTQFLALADPALAGEVRLAGSAPDASALLAAATALCGGAVDLVAVDMPLARFPICSRRNSDQAVSKAYGSRQCGTHSPSASRPGRVSDDLTREFAHAGYKLQTQTVGTPGLIEVYPHPALIELTGASKRLEYKASKVNRYWPSRKPEERRTLLFDQWEGIAQALEAEIRGVGAALPRLELRASAVTVKAHEDRLDAIVCAWVGICALGGCATPYGDEDSAIWIPASSTDRPALS